MALAPWKVLASGKIRTDEEEEKRRQTGENGRVLGFPGETWERNEKEKKISRALEKVAKEVGAKHITAGNYPSPNLNIILHRLMFSFFFNIKLPLHMSCRRHPMFSRLLEVEKSSI